MLLSSEVDVNEPKHEEKLIPVKLSSAKSQGQVPPATSDGIEKKSNKNNMLDHIYNIIERRSQFSNGRRKSSGTLRAEEMAKFTEQDLEKV